MQIYEARPLISKAYLKHKEQWEMTRSLYNLLHKAWFKGEPKMFFPWDGRKEEQKVTRQQHDSLMAMMAAEEKRMRNGK